MKALKDFSLNLTLPVLRDLRGFTSVQLYPKALYQDCLLSWFLKFGNTYEQTAGWWRLKFLPKVSISNLRAPTAGGACNLLKLRKNIKIPVWFWFRLCPITIRNREWYQPISVQAKSLKHARNDNLRLLQSLYLHSDPWIINSPKRFYLWMTKRVF